MVNWLINFVATSSLIVTTDNNFNHFLLSILSYFSMLTKQKSIQFDITYVQLFCQYWVLFQSSVATATGAPLQRSARHCKPRKPPVAGTPAISIACTGRRRLLRLCTAQSEEPPVPTHQPVVRRVGVVSRC